MLTTGPATEDETQTLFQPRLAIKQITARLLLELIDEQITRTPKKKRSDVKGVVFLSISHVKVRETEQDG